jgi:hypothetical protein
VPFRVIEHGREGLGNLVDVVRHKELRRISDDLRQ